MWSRFIRGLPLQLEYKPALPVIPMQILLPFTLVLWLLMPSQTFTCSTAFVHAHDQIREGQIQVTSWSGCELSGILNGAAVRLWADGSSCSLRDKVPGTFQIRWDATCGQVLDLSDGPLPPYCPPSPTPTPIASPSPTPSPSAVTKKCKVWPPWKIWNCL